jgi:hypothetical protein
MKRTCITRRQLLAFTGAAIATPILRAAAVHRAARGTPPFTMCDNTLLLAENLGVGSADLARIEVVGHALSPVQGFPK